MYFIPWKCYLCQTLSANVVCYLHVYQLFFERLHRINHLLTFYATSSSPSISQANLKNLEEYLAQATLVSFSMHPLFYTTFMVLLKKQEVISINFTVKNIHSLNCSTLFHC